MTDVQSEKVNEMNEQNVWSKGALLRTYGYAGSVTYASIIAGIWVASKASSAKQEA